MPHIKAGSRALPTQHPLGGMVTWQVFDVVPCMAKVSEAAAHASEKASDSRRWKRVKGLMEGTKFCRVLWQKLCLLWGL